MIRLLSTPLGAALTALGLLALGAKREHQARETAETVYSLLADEEGEEGSTEVIGIDPEGDRATASVRFGKQVSSIPLVREDGDWRLGSNPAGGS